MVDADNNPSTPLGLKLLALWFVVRFCWDAWILWGTWPDVSVPKLGIAVVLLPLAWLLLLQRPWVVCLAGVVCLFWLAFAVARTIGPWMPGYQAQGSYPWANWVALPVLLYLLHYAQRFAGPGAAATQETGDQPRGNGPPGA